MTKPLFSMVFLGGAVALVLAACEPLSNGPNAEALVAPDYPTATPTLQNADEVKYYPSDQPLRQGYEHFHRGNYGIAERYFRDAVEKAPRDEAAWIGLAASYDRLSRFDLADRAYAQALKLGGSTTEILNNQGYSYMLRGDLVKARAYFRKAYVRDPNNPRIVNNLRLLNASSKFIQRAPEE